MRKIKRAIIMAAGFGSRMRELTKDTPKPLLQVRGIPMIETTIGMLRTNGINDIYIIVGYKKECFAYLTEKYPGVRLLENPYYQSANNIASIYIARDYLEDAMIIEGDQFFLSDAPLKAEFEHSEYDVFYTAEKQPEWTVDADENDRIVCCHEEGKEDGWLMYGVSRWTAEDGKKLKKYLEYEFEQQNNRNIYWDRIPVFLHKDEFEIYIRRTEPDGRVELDTIEELAAFDPSYLPYVGKDEK